MLVKQFLLLFVLALNKECPMSREFILTYN